MNGLGAALPLLIIGLAFVLLIVLPARARSRMQQQARQLQASLSTGTEVMMTCGLYGRVTSLADDTLDLEVSPGVVMRFARAAVSTVTRPDDMAGDDQPGAAGGTDVERSGSDLPSEHGYAEE
ncbi:MAG TPA: preprotein translocase subunit YajC [Mycobacteriales bacterium]|nr:preprotein translocase subunit YajC [Mycobacteriales bacterium]